MNFLLRWVRKLTRLMLGFLLWLNALLLLKITPPSLMPLAVRLHLAIGETTVLVAIVAFSVLLSYGWKNILLDLLYLYFFPFILLYYLVVGTVWLGRLFVRALSGTKSQEKFRESAMPAQLQVEEAAPKQKISTEENLRSRLRSLISHAMRPFLQFTLLWALLLLFASHRWLLWTALVIVLIHLARALFKILVLAVFSIKGLSQLEERIKIRTENFIAKILSYSEQAEPTQDIRIAWTSITGIQLALTILRNKQRVVQWVIFVAVLVFGAIYLYVAVLFAFAYYGVSRIQFIPYSWTEALVTSIFIPFEVSQLPHNIWIETLGGLHCLFVLIIGAGTIFGYLQRKMDSVYKAADSLNERFQDDQVRSRIVLLTEKFKVQTPPK